MAGFACDYEGARDRWRESKYASAGTGAKITKSTTGTGAKITEPTTGTELMVSDPAITTEVCDTGTTKKIKGAIL